MFGVFRKAKRANKGQVARTMDPVRAPPALDPVLYVTGPDYQPQQGYQQKQVYIGAPPPPHSTNQHYNGAPPLPPHSANQHYSGFYPQDGVSPYLPDVPPPFLPARPPKHHPQVGPPKHHAQKHACAGPPPVQNKWVDLDNPEQTVRKGRSRRHKPNVIRSNSAGSVKSQASSINSSYSTKSEQFKNSVRIPDTKFSGSWTSNESVNSRARRKVREWDVDGFRPPTDIKTVDMLPRTGEILSAKNSARSTRSSCGNVSSDSSKPPGRSVPSYLSSGTPPPAYHSDPLSSSHGSNG